jgi:hypothetical protein
MKQPEIEHAKVTRKARIRIYYTYTEFRIIIRQIETDERVHRKMSKKERKFRKINNMLTTERIFKKKEKTKCEEMYTVLWIRIQLRPL